VDLMLVYMLVFEPFFTASVLIELLYKCEIFYSNMKTSILI